MVVLKAWGADEDLGGSGAGGPCKSDSAADGGSGGVVECGPVCLCWWSPMWHAIGNFGADGGVGDDGHDVCGWCEVVGAESDEVASAFFGFLSE